MAYRICYEKSKCEKKRIQKWDLRKRMPLAAVIVLLLGMVVLGLVSPSVQWLLPGDPEVTSAAFGNLQENLQAGENMTDAVAAFCREIVDGAKLAQ